MGDLISLLATCPNVQLCTPRNSALAPHKASLPSLSAYKKREVGGIFGGVKPAYVGDTVVGNKK